MRPITLTEKQRKKILTEFEKTLKDTRALKDFEFKYTMPNLNKKLKRLNVNFDTLAWLKMQTLVENSSDEIAWHGITEISADRNTIKVKDILVYPQIVSRATVTVDDAAYEKWHQDLDDETYNNLLLQGHSHVNMGTSPSGADLALYETMLQVLSPTGYYVFLITNKRGDMWITAYDLAKNLIYDTEDIDVTIADAKNLDDWYKKDVKPLLSAPPAVQSIKTQPYPHQTYSGQWREDFYDRFK